ncbi:peptidoglycan-binding domain-containing protein [Actibacterium lipolyticum]|nr:peptidoglycan-binding domain-containing protein [Actibacterium lipolyticum]
MAVVAASLVVTPAHRAAADAGDVAAGVLLGVIGSAAVNSANKTKKKTYTSTKTKTVYKKPSISSAQRAQNREVQTSLNYFGFPAGTPDGVVGRNTRSAISQYQAHMGYPPTGQLTEYERTFLVSGYHRSIAGGATTAQMIAASPMGTRGLLKTYQQEAAGIAPTFATAAPVAPVVPQQQGARNTVIVVAPKQEAPAAVAPVEEPIIEAAVPAFGAGGLPNFMGASESVSLASHCNKVSLLTNTNGGFTTEAVMTDANFAMNEQFCLARTYAIAHGEELASKVQGFTKEQIAQQCEAFGPALKDQIAGMSLKPQSEVLQEVGAFVLQSGMSPAQLSGTARICLSVGYRTDNMDVALASALMLNALGEPVYGELMGHHLSQGFGAAKRPDLALAWYEGSLDAIAKGATPVFAPGQPERSGLIRKAAYQLGGGADGAALADPTAPKPVSLPTFSVEN